MAASGYVPDDVVAGPTLEIVGGEIGRVDCDSDRGADPVGHADWYAGSLVDVWRWSLVGRRVQPLIGGLSPAPEAAPSEPRRQYPGPGEQRADIQPVLRVERELDIVDVAARLAVSIQQLTIEQI